MKNCRGRVDDMPIAAAPFDLYARIRATLTARPNAPAVAFEDTWYPWSTLADIAAQIDVRLKAADIGDDQPIGLVLRNHPATYAALLAVLGVGCCAVLINPFQSAEAIASDIRRLRPAAVIALAEDWRSDLEEATRAGGTLGLGVRLSPAGAWMVVDRGVGALPEPMTGVAVQMLTSGTTGAPKRVPLSRAGLSRAIGDYIHMSALMGEAPGSDAPEACLIQYAPMAQLSGIYNALQAGAEGRRLVMLEKFSAPAWIAAVRVHRQPMLALPPAMMRMVLEAAPASEDLASLRSVRSGAAPLDAQTRIRFEQTYGAPVLGVYGATEFVGPIASWSLEDYARHGEAKQGSVGKLWPSIAEGRIVDPDGGQSLPTGDIGLLEVLVPRAGPDWIRTNDLARIDQDGFLFILGRADDAINRGGFKIPPDVIADALRAHPRVYDAAAIPLPDARLGQVPVAAVELRAGGDAPTEADLMAFARARLIAYQVPMRILIVPVLPRTPAQKISRPGLQALFGMTGS